MAARDRGEIDSAERGDANFGDAADDDDDDDVGVGVESFDDDRDDDTVRGESTGVPLLLPEVVRVDESVDVGDMPSDGSIVRSDANGRDLRFATMMACANGISCGAIHKTIRP